MSSPLEILSILFTLVITLFYVLTPETSHEWLDDKSSVLSDLVSGSTTTTTSQTWNNFVFCVTSSGVHCDENLALEALRYNKDNNLMAMIETDDNTSSLVTITPEGKVSDHSWILATDRLELDDEVPEGLVVFKLVNSVFAGDLYIGAVDSDKWTYLRDVQCLNYALTSEYVICLYGSQILQIPRSDVSKTNSATISGDDFPKSAVVETVAPSADGDIFFVSTDDDDLFLTSFDMDTLAHKQTLKWEAAEKLSNFSIHTEVINNSTKVWMVGMAAPVDGEQCLYAYSSKGTQVNEGFHFCFPEAELIGIEKKPYLYSSAMTPSGNLLLAYGETVISVEDSGINYVKHATISKNLKCNFVALEMSRMASPTLAVGMNCAYDSPLGHAGAVVLNVVPGTGSLVKKDQANYFNLADGEASTIHFTKVAKLNQSALQGINISAPKAETQVAVEYDFETIDYPAVMSQEIDFTSNLPGSIMTKTFEMKDCVQGDDNSKNVFTLDVSQVVPKGGDACKLHWTPRFNQVKDATMSWGPNMSATPAFFNDSYEVLVCPQSKSFKNVQEINVVCNLYFTSLYQVTFEFEHSGSGNSNGLSPGAIAAIVVGSVIGLIVIPAVILCVMKKRRSKNNTRPKEHLYKEIPTEVQIQNKDKS